MTVVAVDFFSPFSFFSSFCLGQFDLNSWTKSVPVSENLVQTNEQILIPVLENEFVNQRLDLPVTK